MPALKPFLSSLLCLSGRTNAAERSSAATSRDDEPLSLNQACRPDKLREKGAGDVSGAFSPAQHAHSATTCGDGGALFKDDTRSLDACAQGAGRADVQRLIAAIGGARACGAGWLDALEAALSQVQAGLDAEASSIHIVAEVAHISAVPLAACGVGAEDVLLADTTRAGSSMAVLLSSPVLRSGGIVRASIMDSDANTIGPADSSLSLAALTPPLPVMPTDWLAASVRHGLQHWIAAPLLSGNAVVGVLTLATAGGTRPPASWSSGVLAAVAPAVAMMLSPQQAALAAAAVVDVAMSRNVDELVRAVRRTVHDLVCATTYLPPSVRVALIRSDASAACIFEETAQRLSSYVRLSAADMRTHGAGTAECRVPPTAAPPAYTRRSLDLGAAAASAATEPGVPERLPSRSERCSSMQQHTDTRAGLYGLPLVHAPSQQSPFQTPPGLAGSAEGALLRLAPPPVGAPVCEPALARCSMPLTAGDQSIGTGTVNWALQHAASFHAGSGSSNAQAGALSPAPSPAKGGARGHSLSLGNTLLGEALAKNCGLWIPDCTTYLQEAKTVPRDIVISRGGRAVHSLAVAAGRQAHGRPVIAAYCVYGNVLPRQLLRAVSFEVEQLLKLLAPHVARQLCSPLLVDEWTYLHEELLNPALVDTHTAKRGPRTSVPQFFSFQGSSPGGPAAAGGGGNGGGGGGGGGATGINITHVATGCDGLTFVPGDPSRAHSSSTTDHSFMLDALGPARNSVTAAAGAASPGGGGGAAAATAKATDGGRAARGSVPGMQSSLPVPAGQAADGAHELPSFAEAFSMQRLVLEQLQREGATAVSPHDASASPAAAAVIASASAMVAAAASTGTADAATASPAGVAGGAGTTTCSQSYSLAASGGGSGVGGARVLAAAPSFTVESVRNTVGGGRFAPLVSGLHERLAAAQACRLVHGSAVEHQEELAAIEVMDKIGQGGYGEVYRGHLDGSEVAIKIVYDPSHAAASTVLPYVSAVAPPPRSGALGAAGASCNLQGADAAATTNRHEQRDNRNFQEAFELTVSVAVTHPNIVQVLTFFTDVFVHADTSSSTETAGGPGAPRALAAAAYGGPGGGGAAGGAAVAAVPAASAAAGLQRSRTGSSGTAAAAAAARVTLLPYPIANGASCQLHMVDLPGASTNEYVALQAAMASNGSAAAALVSAAPPAMVICMEYCDAGCLTDVIVRGAFRQPSLGLYGSSQPNMKAVFATLLEGALALRHLHALRLVHCDLKPSNILLKTNPRDPRGFTAKLSDFGLVRLMEMSGDGELAIPQGVHHGTVTHMAPEVLAERLPHDSSLDIYAFGIIMWQIVTGGRLYPGVSQADIATRVVREGLRPRFLPSTPPEYRQLAESCWSAQPASRPSASELVASLKRLMGLGPRMQGHRRYSALGPPRGVQGGGGMLMGPVDADADADADAGAGAGASPRHAPAGAAAMPSLLQALQQQPIRARQQNQKQQGNEPQRQRAAGAPAAVAAAPPELAVPAAVMGTQAAAPEASGPLAAVVAEHCGGGPLRVSSKGSTGTVMSGGMGNRSISYGEFPLHIL